MHIRITQRAFKISVLNNNNNNNNDNNKFNLIFKIPKLVDLHDLISRLVS